jgi:hypothetical protein
MNDPVELFLENTKEVRQLVEFHTEKTGTDRGRRFGVEILNKSAIVLLTACWEAFIEDSASAAFESMLQNTSDPTKLSAGVLRRVAKLLKDDKNDLKVWDLAGGGWRKALLSYKEHILHAHVSFFNTPKAGNIDKLFDALLDLPDVSSHWSWRKMSAQGAKDRLGYYIDLRGSIAHRVQSSAAVHKKHVTDYQDFINRLAVRTANVTREHVHSLVVKYPWERYQIGAFE